MKTLAKEKDQLEREKWDLRRQAKEATEHAGILRSQLDLRENRIKELEAELTMVTNTQMYTVTQRLWAEITMVTNTQMYNVTQRLWAEITMVTNT